ncbi:hypothetical protein L6164_029152 [Bauhinia variegata]|uniref:Uncharacterized protein n=1 Tax=Bauhinia variegata TaxID=167791 RepID=A0ACB9L7X3_BAUVA|nr:hypothetical protein L6164_029152 [Bauhinia variegata]
METIIKSLPLAKVPKSHACSASPSPLWFHSNASSVAFNPITSRFPKCFLTYPPGVLQIAKEQKNLGAIRASETESPSTDSGERWLLVPVGDGDSRHIGFKVEMPGAYEIASNEVTVGRVPGKADLVIPVATVSGVHARIQKKDGKLLVTDLDSTNGTFVDDKRLRPGVVATVSSGSSIIFGDIHLAMFRVSKLANVENAGKAEAEETGDAQVSDDKTENAEIS